MQIKIDTREIFIYKIDNDEQRTVRDIEIYKNYICALYDKNEVIVYNVKT